MDFTTDFASAQQNISVALVSTTRTATQISAEDVTFHRASSANVARLLDSQNARLLALAEQLLRSATSTFRAHLTDVESIDSHWNNVVDAIDSLLERSDTCLDEYNGRFKNQPTQQSDELTASRAQSAKKGVAFRTQNLSKPQLLFEHIPNNHETSPFQPYITSKPHALLPLEKSLALNRNVYGHEQHEHPYQHEIDNYAFPSSVYTESEPLPYMSFEDTEATFVDDYDGVLVMLEELKSATEIAIDLEHHDTHSYVGIVSLMQISTRNHDWIVDTLKPWRRKLEVLNEVFADPKIVKVLHGAQMDAVWLQRDLGLYLVGLFDTHHASRVLGYSAGSLAFLLKKFIDFDAQKQYQTADWRIRPLPKEMFDYARSDTHFLLYIYDNMRNELIQRSRFDIVGEDRVQEVLVRSKETALQRYEHFIYDEDRGTGRGGWFNLLQRNMSNMSKEQFAVYRKVHQWRDRVAREEDENIGLVMPNHVVFKVARSLPRDMPTLLSLAHPISPSLRLRTEELLDLILQTIADTQHEPEMNEKLDEILRLEPSLAWRSTYIPTPSVVNQQHSAVTVSSSSLIAADNNIRSSSSAFWGMMLNTNSRRPKDVSLDMPAPRLALPLPHYGLDEFKMTSVEERGVTSAALASAPGSEHHNAGNSLQHIPARGVSSYVTGKRKAASVADGDDSLISDVAASTSGVVEQSDDTSSHITAAEAAAIEERRAAKRARKAAKLQKAMESSEAVVSDVAGDSGEAAQPFDYDTAPSVLHAVRPAGVRGGAKEKGGKKAFNPYAKGEGAALGVKKSHGMSNGKSWTFKH